LIFSFNVNAEVTKYFGKDKTKWSQTEFRKTKNDFAAWLLVTPDTDWQQKWDTSPDTVPYFREATSAKRGEPLAIWPFSQIPKQTKKMRPMLFAH
jgi:hypothetical protein